MNRKNKNKFILNELCSFCKKPTKHEQTIVLDLSTGKWVHKECEYKAGRKW